LTSDLRGGSADLSPSSGRIISMQMIEIITGIKKQGRMEEGFTIITLYHSLFLFSFVLLILSSHPLLEKKRIEILKV
jgi:hypothetical protein